MMALSNAPAWPRPRYLAGHNSLSYAHIWQRQPFSMLERMRAYQRGALAQVLFAYGVFVEAIPGGPTELLQTLLLMTDFLGLCPVCGLFASTLERWADTHQVMSTTLSLDCHEELALVSGSQKLADLGALAIVFAA